MCVCEGGIAREGVYVCEGEIAREGVCVCVRER